MTLSPFSFQWRRGGVQGMILGCIGVVAILAILFFLAKSSRPADNGIVLYWGIGCPHCTKVEAFLQENKVEAKVPLTKKEVYEDKKNAFELSKRAKTCGLPADNIAVPFLWTGKTCLIGDIDIIKFFQDAVRSSSSSAGQ